MLSLAALLCSLLAASCFDIFSDDMTEVGFLTMVNYSTLVAYKATKDDDAEHDTTYASANYAIDCSINCYCLDYHWKKKLIFATTDTDKVLVFNSGNSSTSTINVKDAQKQLAVDWVNDHIFFEVYMSNRYAIMQYDLQGNMKGKMAEFDGRVESLVVDPYARTIFWATSNPSEVTAMNYKSGDLKIIVKADSVLGYVARLAIDLPTRRVFHLEKGWDWLVSLFSTDYSGNDQVEHMKSSYGGPDFRYSGLGVFRNCAYFERTELHYGRYIYKSSLDDSKTPQEIIINQYAISDMKIIHRELQMDPPFGQRNFKDIDETSLLITAVAEKISVPTTIWIMALLLAVTVLVGAYFWHIYRKLQETYTHDTV